MIATKISRLVVVLVAGLSACLGTGREVVSTNRQANSSNQQVRRSASRPTRQATAQHFSGRALVSPIAPANEHLSVATAYVTFEPGAHSAWHTHTQGQHLLVTEGVGLTQQWGKPAEAVFPGDAIWCPPGVKHWHGAAPDTPLTHLAITGHVEGRRVTWLERVSVDQYQAAAQAALPHRANRSASLQSLSPRQQAIPVIAAYMAASNGQKLNLALHQGLDSGLSVSEAKEILVQLYAYTGFPRSLNALKELMSVLDARRQRGIQDEPGVEPHASMPTGDALLTLGTANQTRIAGAPVQGPLFDFAPVINRYLQSHLFGDIFARDNLDWQSRELATVGALAGTPGVEPQLRSHMAASMRVGLTEIQLRAVAEVLRQQVSEAAGLRARQALVAALARAHNKP